MYQRYNKEEIENLVINSISWAEVVIKSGRKPTGGTQTHMKNFCKKHEIDNSHFKGQGHGKTKGHIRIDIQTYLNNEKGIKSDSLRKKLIRLGFKKAKCEICNNTEWNGELIDLELDHIDSNHFNNNLNNLQILCPNCHAQLTRKRKMAL